MKDKTNNTHCFKVTDENIFFEEDTNIITCLLSVCGVLQRQAGKPPVMQG